MKKYLIVGLGNIGAEYSETRHNIGFKVLDALAGASNIFFASDRYADRASYSLKGRQIHLIKPTTYMNLSGKAVNYWLQHEKVPLQNLLVIVDEIALPFGALRLKTKGSDGGHNGLKHINQVLGRQDYARLRFGVGNEFPKGQQVNYVLGEWSPEQKEALPERILKATKAIESFVLAGPQLTMTQFNGN
ncbi:MAG: aminoacyl-tRNA hydrolase [Owenweeksia sp.]